MLSGGEGARLLARSGSGSGSAGAVVPGVGVVVPSHHRRRRPGGDIKDSLLGRISREELSRLGLARYSRGSRARPRARDVGAGTRGSRPPSPGAPRTIYLSRSLKIP